MEEHVADDGGRDSRGLQGGRYGRAEVLVVRREVAFEEPDHEEGDSLRLVLGRDELARELVAVLEVVRDGRMDAPIDGLEAVVPP